MPHRIVVLDLVAETNAGDRALHRGLLELVRERWPNASVDVVVMLGPNQMGRVGSDFPSLVGQAGVTPRPVLRPTFFNDRRGIRRVLAEGGNLVGLLVGMAWRLVARGSPSIARGLLPRSARATFDSIRAADIVLWKGKNFRRRDNRFLEWYRIASRLHTARVAQTLGADVVLVGASVWDLRSRPARRAMRNALSQCSAITVRETESLARVRELVGPKMPLALAPDLALVWLRQHAEAPPAPPVATVRSVAVTLVDWSEFGSAARDRYVQALAGYLDWLGNRGELQVTIVPQVTKPWESAGDITDQLLSRTRVGDSITVLPPPDRLEDILDVYREADLLVGTRMHSTVFALAVGTPVIAIPYDVGAKWQILRDLGVGELMVDYDEVSTELLIELHRHVEEDGARIMAAVATKLADQYAVADRNLGPHS
jgi:colanic acid/amylovoran biosynthesis protein